MFRTTKFKSPRPIDGKPAPAPSDHERHERRTPPVAAQTTGTAAAASGCASAAPTKRVKHPRTTRQTTLNWQKPRNLQMVRVPGAHKTNNRWGRSPLPPSPAAAAAAAAATTAAPPPAATTTAATTAAAVAAAAAAAAPTPATATTAVTATTAPRSPSPSPPPPPPTLCGSEDHPLRPEKPCCSPLSPNHPVCRPIAEAVTGEEGSTFTPDTPTAGGGSGGVDCKAFIMAAETPARNRASLDHRSLRRVKKTARLRVPDTQEGAEQEPQPKPQPEAEQKGVRVSNRPKVGGHVTAERGRVSNRPESSCGDVNDGKGGSGPSDLIAPPPPPIEFAGGRGESRGASVSVDIAGVGVALAGCVEARSSSDGGSSSGSLSPDLLRRCPTGATAVSENLGRGGVAGRFAAGQGEAGSSDGSDTWPESPDLLGGYVCKEGLSEVSAVSTREAGAGEATETKGQGGEKLQQWSCARSSEASEGQQRHAAAATGATTAMAHQGRPGNVPGRENLSCTGTAVIAKDAKPLAMNSSQGMCQLRGGLSHPRAFEKTASTGKIDIGPSQPVPKRQPL
ncbi:unnamed protein product [Laminaria digitata]